eukprot:Phypoly_transcript_11017.p1 GENE.Phypoly_transcript_11017~~Phypoly_transcript_11017.p1  ORF type:complete len:373 (+),score=29.54 Phypoly_transcript_11017:25-1119(+)
MSDSDVFESELPTRPEVPFSCIGSIDPPSEFALPDLDEEEASPSKSKGDQEIVDKFLSKPINNPITTQVFGGFSTLEDSLSPVPIFEGVVINFVGGGSLSYPTAQEDNRCSVGIAISLHRMTALAVGKPGWLKFIVHAHTPTSECESITAVAEVEIPSIGLKTYTTVSGLANLRDDQVLVGRFLVLDAQNRFTRGELAEPIHLPLKVTDFFNFLIIIFFVSSKGEQLVEGPAVSVESGTYTLTACPTYPVLIARFQRSPAGRKLLADITAKNESAKKSFENKEFVKALNDFIWISVYGFFVLTDIERTENFFKLGRTACEVKVGSVMDSAKYWMNKIATDNPSVDRYQKKEISRWECPRTAPWP